MSCLDAVERRLAEAAEAQRADPQGTAWWKLREAALLALGSVSQHLEEVALSERGGGGGMVEQAFTGECMTEYLEEAAPREWRG